MSQRPWAAAAVLSLVVAASLQSQNPTPQRPTSSTATVTARGITLDSTLLAAFRWRNIGPANMMGRVTDVEGVPGVPEIVYVAAASGGVWKTTDTGTTWKPIFDEMEHLSIGDIALEAGFFDQSHFTRAFKRHTGLTPREYRQSFGIAS